MVKRLVVMFLLLGAILPIVNVEAGELDVNDITFKVEAGSGKNLRYLGYNRFAFDLEHDTDEYSPNYWFKFKIIRDAAGKTVTFVVNTVNKPFFSYAFLKPVYSYDGLEWHQIDNRSYDESKYTFTFTQTFIKDSVTVAVGYPYSFSNLETYVDSIKSLTYVHHVVLGHSSDGNKIHMLTITDPNVSSKGKNEVLMVAGQHSAETHGMWVVQGMIEELIHNPELRKKYIYHIIPMANPDGNIAGKSRFDTNGVDLNREWDDVSTMEPEVKAIYDFIASKRYSLDLVVDSHTQPFNPYTITYSRLDPTAKTLANTIAKYTKYDGNENGYGGGSTLTGLTMGSFKIPSIILEHSQCKESFNLYTFLDDGAGLTKAIDEYFDAVNPSEPEPPSEDGVIYLLKDGFEDPSWNYQWDESSRWYRSTYEHSGTQCAAARYGYDGAFTTKSMDARGAQALHVEFWYMKYRAGAGDYNLYYWDGSSYVFVDDLTDNGGDYPTWLKFSQEVTDPRFFVPDFKIRLVATLNSGEDVWLDDVVIYKKIEGPEPEPAPTPKPNPDYQVVVLLQDGFESSVWNVNWGASSSKWYRNTYEHSGTQCAAARYGYDGSFTCDPLDASDAVGIHVEFWYMKYRAGAGDYNLYYWDGSSYVFVDDLTDNGGDYPTWLKFSQEVTDPRFFVDGFRIRLVARMGSDEDVWLDDVLITKNVPANEPVEVTLLSDSFESSVWNVNWDASSSKWYRNTHEHSGTQCAAARYGYDGSFTSDPLDAGDAVGLQVEFWYMKYRADAGDYCLYFWDGTSYVYIYDLTENRGDYPSWLKFSMEVTDSRFFVPDFRIRLVAKMESDEDVWLDDVIITKKVIP